MTSNHTRWVHPEAEVDDPERIAIREALAFGKALYDRRTALGLSIDELAAPSQPWRCCGYSQQPWMPMFV